MRRALSVGGIARRVAFALEAMATARIMAAAPQQTACKRIAMMGEVNAGQEFHAAFGEGWVFQVLPIDRAKTPPGHASYSGWDLVVDREQPAGFPDALLLATPPMTPSTSGRWERPLACEPRALSAGILAAFASSRIPAPFAKASNFTTI